jgi:hypothetical protein
MRIRISGINPGESRSSKNARIKLLDSDAKTVGFAALRSNGVNALRIGRRIACLSGQEVL